jgi:hypothetical protein
MHQPCRASRIGGVALAVTALAVATVAFSGPAASAPDQDSGLNTRHRGQSQAQLISGTSTLIRVSPSGRTSGQLHVLDNGRDITNAFRQQDDGSYLGWPPTCVWAPTR